MTREEVLQGLECCADYLCGSCPYQHLESWKCPTKCIHALLVDLKELREKEEEDR